MTTETFRIWAEKQEEFKDFKSKEDLDAWVKKLKNHIKKDPRVGMSQTSAEKSTRGAIDTLYTNTWLFNMDTNNELIRKEIDSAKNYNELNKIDIGDYEPNTIDYWEQKRKVLNKQIIEAARESRITKAYDRYLDGINKINRMNEEQRKKVYNYQMAVWEFTSNEKNIVNEGREVIAVNKDVFEERFN